jgi:hypothetical protein
VVAQRTVNFDWGVAAGLVGDDRLSIVLAARDTSADSRRLVGLDRRDRLQLAEAPLAYGGWAGTVMTLDDAAIADIVMLSAL